jgi:hypothetical protein
MVESLSGLALGNSNTTVGSAYDADDIDWHGRLGLAQIASAVTRPLQDAVKGRYKRDLKNPDEGKKKKAEEGLKSVRARSKAAQSTVQSLAESIVKRKKSDREAETGKGGRGRQEPGGEGDSTAGTQIGPGKTMEEIRPLRRGGSGRRRRCGGKGRRSRIWRR